MPDEKSFKKYLSSKRDGDYLLVVKNSPRAGTGKQKRYYWGVIVDMISCELGYTPLETHEILKYMFLRFKNGNYEYIKSTTGLTTIETEDYYTKIRNWASSFLSMYIPLPNEIEIPISYNIY